MKKILKLCIIILLILSFIVIINNMKLKSDLKKLGYNDNQIIKLYDKDIKIKEVLKYDYCPSIDILLNDFDDTFYDKLSSCNVSDETSKEEPNDKEDIRVTKLMREKYYIPSNLDRYLKYWDEAKTAKEIVSEVNCNLDYPYYTNTKKTDLSKGNLILVNKYYYVDENFVPNNKKVLKQNVYTYWEGAELAHDAYEAFIKLVDDAKELGYSLIDTSPYRTYSYQSYLYNNYVDRDGVKEADTYSARPGHSEHQTGLATDIVKVGVSMYDFYSTKEFSWLKDNAYKYGFILRYPKGKEHLTGYMYEPWHYRYVGESVAKYIYENDIVYEEYYAYFCEYKNEC